MADKSHRRSIRALLLLVVTALIAGALLWPRRPQPVQAEFLVFGTRARIQLNVRHRDDAEGALTDIGRLFAYDHRTWHPWEASELTRLNDALAQGQSRRVPADLVDMIRRAQTGFIQSEGLFNAAAGRLIGAWGFHTSEYPVRTSAPSADQIHTLLMSHASMSDVHISADGMVSSTNPAITLDLNGLAEGYAAAQVHRLLTRHGIDAALIYIGGFVLAVGDNQGQPWHVGVGKGAGVLGSVDLDDGEALSSSGDYQRHRAASTDQGHIIDTRAGAPQRASAASSVISNDPVFADMAATALMVAGPTGFQQLAGHMHLGCALLMGHDGVLYLTPAMLARLHLAEPSAILRVIPQPMRQCDLGASGGDREAVLPPEP